ncbi:hypothetical protein HN51_019992 [Arachis hypogaea]
MASDWTSFSSSLLAGESFVSSYCQRVKGGGDSSVSSGSSSGARLRVTKGESPRYYCKAYAIVVESRTEKNPKRPLFEGSFYRLDKVFYYEVYGGQDDAVLANKVKKLKELVDAFEKKNKNAIENRGWFRC